MKGDPLRGVHAFYSASAREWWAPLRPDRQLSRRNALVGVLDKPSEFAGRAVHEWTGPGVPRGRRPRALGAVPADDPHRAHAGPRPQEERRAWSCVPIPTTRSTPSRRSTPARGPRGAETRWWEDVAEGDAVGPMVKGPLTVTDMVCWHAGDGHGALRREARCASATRTGPGSRASSTATSSTCPTSCSGCIGTPSSPAAPATRRRSTTGACARRGSSTSAPTGWATTGGCGSSTASSASSTTWATRSGSRAA